MVKPEKISLLHGFNNTLGVYTTPRCRDGLINTDGEIVLEPCCQFIHWSNALKQPMLYGVADTKGRKRNGFFDVEKREVVVFDEQFYLKKYGYAITRNGRWAGLVDADGQIAITHKYANLKAVDDFNLYVALRSNGKVGLISCDGKIIIPCEYDDLYIEGDSATVMQDGKWHFMDVHGRCLSYRVYDRCYTFKKNGYAIIGTERNGIMYYGVVDKNEQIVISPTYQNLYWLDIENNLLAAGDKQNITVIDVDGNRKLYGSFSYIHRHYRNAYIVYNYGSKSPIAGVVCEDGRSILPVEFKSISMINDTYVVSGRRNRHSLYTLDGEIIFSSVYDLFSCNNNFNYMAVCKHGEWFYVNSRGERTLF